MQHNINGNNYVESILGYIKILLSQNDYLRSNVEAIQKHIGNSAFLVEASLTLEDIGQKLHSLEDRILKFDKNKVSKILLETNVMGELNEFEDILNNRLNTKISRLIQSYLNKGSSKNDNSNRYQKN